MSPRPASGAAAGRRDPARLEVHLEELGEHSWARTLVNTVTGSFGSAQFRFVARTVGRGPGDRDHAASDDVFVGATFPLLRWQDLDDRSGSDVGTELATERLQELDREVTRAGWVRDGGTGRHWWSRSYHRLEHPVTPAGGPAGRRTG